MNAPIKRHDGGRCPVPGETEVVVQYRNQQVSPEIQASKRRWKSWPHGQSSWDIVRYREARPIGEIVNEVMADIIKKMEANQ